MVSQGTSGKGRVQFSADGPPSSSPALGLARGLSVPPAVLRTPLLGAAACAGWVGPGAVRCLDHTYGILIDWGSNTWSQLRGVLSIFLFPFEIALLPFFFSYIMKT